MGRWAGSNLTSLISPYHPSLFMTPGTIAAIAYAILAIGGGIMGYAQVKSKMSLISGIISGSLLLVGGIAQQQGMSWGLPLSVAVTAALIVVFAVRWFKTRKIMPAGLMIGAGVAALAGMLLQIT
jgi:uncharacterized membrane protein (UPF0136 family)